MGGLRWTHKAMRNLAVALRQRGVDISYVTVGRLLREMKYSLRTNRKRLAKTNDPDRDRQFRLLAQRRNRFEREKWPVISIDCKKKELLGNFKNPGKTWRRDARDVFDHDFPSWADGVIIPHGIYDRVRNRGHINIGLSHDTSQFAWDSLLWYWNRIGQQCYPDATSILLLCDCGGSNAARTYIFKHDLQTVADTIGLEIRVAHYPSYCSKYNPIERRLFPHITRACTGMLFDTLETVVELMRKTTTSTGLRTTVNVIHRLYETGRNATEEIKSNLKIVFDDVRPKWNYRAMPQSATVIA